MQKETISISEAAHLLGCNKQAIRERIRKKIWTFGEVIPKEKPGMRSTALLFIAESCISISE